MIARLDLPHEALLRKDRDAGAYTDCYATEIATRIPHAAYVEAFYTTWVFKLERVLLKWLVEKPSTDDEARRLSRGELDAFAAWSATRLYFGSAVVRMSSRYKALLGFHKLYSRILLAAAKSRLLAIQ